MRLPKLVRLWLCLATNSFRTQIATSLGSAGYLVGKLLRLGFFLAYLIAIFRFLPDLHGYSVAQVVLFFMTFNIVDVGSQFLFRGLYGVKSLIEEGDFDKIITQPAPPLFRIASMGVDLLDLLTLIPIGIVTVITVHRLPHPVTPADAGLFALLIGNAMLISFAFHVFVATLSVRTQEMESAIWVYRDVMTLGRFPVGIYSDFLRSLLTTLVPIGVMISFPAQAMMGLLSPAGVVYSFAVGLAAVTAAVWWWRMSLKEYTSIST